MPEPLARRKRLAPTGFRGSELDHVAEASGVDRKFVASVRRDSRSRAKAPRFASRACAAHRSSRAESPSGRGQARRRARPRSTAARTRAGCATPRGSGRSAYAPSPCSARREHSGCRRACPRGPCRSPPDSGMPSSGVKVDWKDGAALRCRQATGLLLSVEADLDPLHRCRVVEAVAGCRPRGSTARAPAHRPRCDR